MGSCRFSSSPGWSRIGLAIGLLAAVSCLITACSSGPVADPNAVIGIETSQMAVTLHNRAGLTLTDLDVAIIPVGGQVQYTKFVPRLGNEGKADIMFAEFSGRDGTPFNLRVVKPRSVKVTAKDMMGKTYQVESPWK